jgi:GT2 family glycosyltransferase
MNSSKNLPLISVVIPNHTGAGYLEACLRSLLAQPSEELEIVVVDNASVDKSVEMAASLAPKAILLKESRNLGFAGGVNAGIRVSRGEWIAVLNNDTVLAPDWLAECIRGIQTQPQAAFFACRILDFSDRARIYSAGDCFLRGGIGYRRGQELRDREDFHQECEIFSASGCAALFRREVLTQIGAYDERFFAYLEDVDLGLRLQAKGHHGVYLPRAVVYHHGAATSGGEFSPLAVRLRTRNALLLLLKNMPMRIIFRCLPMILLTQLSWLARVLVHGRLGSYIRGLAGACRYAPAMIRDRTGLDTGAKSGRREFWHRILQSESLARKDFERSTEEKISLFLKWYFRLF